MKSETSNQVKTPPNPTGKGGFGDNPQNINLSGHWKKEDTPRFKLEQMMKLGEDELRKVAESKDAPLFERKLAISIRKGEWREIKEMIQEVYGRPKESVDVTSNGETLKTAVVEFVNPPGDIKE